MTKSFCNIFRFRHAAIRSLGGIRRLPLNISQTDAYSSSNPNSPNLQPKLATVVGRLAAARKLNPHSSAIQGNFISSKSKAVQKKKGGR